jgi:DNA-directed RNA polymerase specialized sigma24 family protein
MLPQPQSADFDLGTLCPRFLTCGRRAVTPEAFGRLLEWLHEDREEAGRVYETIRRKLIRVFACRGCDFPEELADETIDRVAEKSREVADNYRGDPALYFYGVARNVCREYRKTRKVRRLSPPEPAAESRELDCLEACMRHLTQNNREMLLEYYQEDGRAKIEHRRLLADRYGLDMNALRIRLHRIRSAVGECTAACLQSLKDA